MAGRSVAGLLRRLVRRRPRRYRYVFVVTYGRSGSTLVQGLLNTLPRTLVRGENSLYVLELFRAMHRVRSLRRRHLKHHPRRSSSAFFGLHELTPRSFVVSARELVTGHLLGDVRPREVDVLGFKEVLWNRVEPDETSDFFDYLDRVFPACQYVLNQRDHEQVVGSGFWQAHDRDEVLGTIHRIEEIQDHLRRTRPDRVFDLDYGLLTSPDPGTSDAQLRGLTEFVHGSCDEVLLARMRETLATGHGPFPFGRSRSRREGWRRGGRGASVEP